MERVGGGCYQSSSLWGLMPRVTLSDAASQMENLHYIIYSLMLAGCMITGVQTEGKREDRIIEKLREMKCLLQVNQPCHLTDHIKFYLYSRDQKKEELNLKHKYPPDRFDPSKNMKVLIHGFSSVDFMNSILQGYLERGGDSVLVVDWERLSRKPCYLSAKMNTQQVGRCTGEALTLLRPQGQLHIVGFSLGAHVAGIVSAYLATHHGIKVDRITDPPLCSHRRAAEVFAESINSEKGFWGVRCPSLFRFLSGYCRQIRTSGQRVLMGEYAAFSSKGIYLVQTNRTSPYALG